MSGGGFEITRFSMKIHSGLIQFGVVTSSRRNYLVKYVTVGKIEEIEWEGGRGRWSIQLMDDVKEKRVRWKLGEEALDRSVWRTHFERGYGTVVRQTSW
jgi:hypothetical protein